VKCGRDKVLPYVIILLWSKFFLSFLFSNARNLRSSSKQETMFHTHKKSDKITVSCLLIFSVMDDRMAVFPN